MILYCLNRTHGGGGWKSRFLPSRKAPYSYPVFPGPRVWLCACALGIVVRLSYTRHHLYTSLTYTPTAISDYPKPQLLFPFFLPIDVAVIKLHTSRGYVAHVSSALVFVWVRVCLCVPLCLWGFVCVDSPDNCMRGIQQVTGQGIEITDHGNTMCFCIILNHCCRKKAEFSYPIFSRFSAKTAG